MRLFATRCDLKIVRDLVNNREDHKTGAWNIITYKNENDIGGFVSISYMNPPIADDEKSIFS